MKKATKALILFFILISVTQTYAHLVCNSAQTIRFTFKKPTQLSADKIEFKIGKTRGLQLKNQQCFEFIVPEVFRNRIPDYSYIRHRKEHVYYSENDKGLDPNNPWVQVTFHNPEDNRWYVWSDQFGPLKRSAARPDEKPKKNTLYNFRQNVGVFSPDKIRITNLAQGDPELAIASIHKLGMVYLNQRETEASKTTVFTEYFQPNNLTLRFIADYEHGMQLKKNHSFVFAIPEQLQNKSIFHIILKHRKALSLAHDPLNPEAYDPNAAYILVEAHNKETGYWHKWADRSSLAKFSEVRTHDNPEDETLHNCLRTFGAISPDKIRLTNVGLGEPDKCISRIHELEVVFYPDVASSESIEKIFTPETSFSKPQTGQPVPLLGGGPRLDGKFPGALVLGKNFQKRIEAIQQLPQKHSFKTAAKSSKGYKITEEGDLLIKLPVNKQIESIELAIGDLDITAMDYNKDGYFGRSGRAQASIYLLKEGKRAFTLLTANNIGMAGMIVSGGPTENYVTGNNDFIKVEVENDNAFLMGYRVLLKN